MLIATPATWTMGLANWADAPLSIWAALTGIALGILAGNKAKVASVISACAPIILVYFPLVIAGSNLARAGTLPVYPALWMGNAVLAVGGSYLLYRVARR